MHFPTPDQVGWFMDRLDKFIFRTLPKISFHLIGGVSTYLLFLFALEREVAPTPLMVTFYVYVTGVYLGARLEEMAEPESEDDIKNEDVIVANYPVEQKRRG